MKATGNPAPTLELHRSPLAARREILTPEAVEFVADLERRFGPVIDRLLAARAERRFLWDAGESLDFLPETAAVRAASWRVAPIVPELSKRHVEITGPVDRKMIINALNSGADVFMADFEDSCSPTWANLIDGQRNLYDAVRSTISLHDPASGRDYRLNERTAVLMVRPRGLHLPERRLAVDGRAAHGSLVDFGLHFFHNVRELIARGSGPWFYLPKLESHREARLWNDVFLRAQERLGLPKGTIRATVLIETLPAAFEMDEILFELRDHSAGLNCGRWDYIFSAIKTRRLDPAAVFPDRSQVTMDQPSMRAYTRLVVATCHRRGIHAMGGMAAQIPIKGDPEANERALEKVRADKRREADDGHDGTWVAHPGLVPIAREIFSERVPGDHQIDRELPPHSATAADLLAIPAGTRTALGLRRNVRVGIEYVAAWLGGNGCVPLANIMEDAATAEISRAQLWQWQRHGARLDDGTVVTKAVLESVVGEEWRDAASRVMSSDAAALIELAAELMRTMITNETLDEFLTLPAQAILERRESPAATKTEREAHP